MSPPARVPAPGERWLPWGVLTGMLLALFWPILVEPFTLGFHDWDAHATHRLATVRGLLEFREGPWWNPHLCGGYPGWAYVEGAPNLVSPFLPFYLLLPLELAVRAELVGAAAITLAGLYALAGRFVQAPALRLFVAVVAGCNGRFALQAAAGHAWHFHYGLLFWALTFFDRACRPAPDGAWRRDLALAAGAVAMLVYTGAIYPLPHAVIALAVFAGGHALWARSPRPLLLLLATGGLAVALSAPKLLPALDKMVDVPRLVESPEVMTPRQLLAALVDQDQAFDRPPPAGPWGWHEWGIYVGWGPLVLMVLGAALARGGPARILQSGALLFAALALGSFASWAPWSLLHRLPIFASQHVPTRFAYVAVALAALAAAVGLEPLLGRWQARTDRWGKLAPRAGTLAVVLIALDLARVGAPLLSASFRLRRPALAAQPVFRQHARPRHSMIAPDDIHAGRNRGTFYVKRPSTLLSVQANEGSVRCYGLPIRRSAVLPVGRRPVETEVFVARADAPALTVVAPARVLSWSPNHVRVEVAGDDLAGEAPGPLRLVYNMNHDPSWRAEGRAALSHGGLVATPLPDGFGPGQRLEVTFRYRPRTLTAGLALCGLALLLLARPWRWWRRAPG